jgi:galactonate dehydratase
MTPAVARRAIDALAEARVGWFECPIAETLDSVTELGSLRRLANARGMVLAGLEELTSVDAFRPYLAGGAYDVVMPDVKYVGGIAALEAAAALAAEHGVQCAPHNPSGPVCHAASLAVCAASTSIGELELQFDETPHFFAIAGVALPRPSHGESAAPSSAGLGVELELEGIPVSFV